jgi:serine/threonine protein kinase
MEIEEKPGKNLSKPNLFLSSLLPSHSSSSSSMAILLVLFYTFSASTIAFSAFVPADNFLIDCGADKAVTNIDGRIFKTEEESKQFLQAKDEIKVSVEKADVPSPVDLSGRIFVQEATYSFHLSQPGWHWVRLHFYPLKNDQFDLSIATFSVSTNKYVLLHSFNMDNATNYVMKEYLLNVTEEQFSIKFVPMKKSAAFINAIEVVSAPDAWVDDTVDNLYPAGKITGITTYAYQTLYRLNVGGPLITSVNDSLGRTWTPDDSYLLSKNLANKVSVPPNLIKDPGELTPLIAPRTVYASVVEMADAHTNNPRFNVTWNFKADPGFGYLIRLHFCDIVSKVLATLYFDVYINGKIALSDLDLSHDLENQLAAATYKDFVVNASFMSNGLTVQIGPSALGRGDLNAILNGLEVLKMSNSVDSLDGEFGVDGTEVESGGKTRTAVATIGFAMMFAGFVGLGAMAIKWHRRPQDWQKRNSFSSWLLPLHAGDTSFMSKNSMGSHKTNLYSSAMGLGRYFSFAELQEATKNFDPKAVIGVGGFGNVYIGTIDDGTQVAVKRGNPQSEQGITEFQTEIQMLSKLRHRHLVSLIGYCDENSEMILVYEFMSNGPFRDHLYGKNLPALSWKQRLEICIGSARGLHYLHTGTQQGIIHRDVKTTNILLDENLTAKVADFGLSKDAPTGQAHVSTAVKGSFGYLDPEYFRRQQLTDKSDVYSFGVVLLEAICARPALNPALPREQVNLADWAMQWKRKGMLDKIIDPLLVGSVNPESMKKFAEAAEKCLAEHGVDRPTMGDVLWNLESALQLQEVFSHGKVDQDETKATAIVDASPATVEASPAIVSAAPATTTSDTRPVSHPEENNTPAQVQATDEHSGTAIFTQFASLSGR